MLGVFSMFLDQLRGRIGNDSLPRSWQIKIDSNENLNAGGTLTRKCGSGVRNFGRNLQPSKVP